MDSNLLLLSLLAAVLIIVIAAVRRRLVFEIQAVSLIAVGNPKAGIYLYSLFFLPGTILHELSHWLVAEILQVPTGKFEVLPDLTASSQGEERLGYVMTARTGPFRGFLIGFAPLFTGISLLIILGYVLNNLWGTAPWWQIVLVIYGLIVISNSMLVSSADRRNWPLIAIIAILIISIFWYLGLSFSPNLSTLFSNILVRINQALGLTIGLNLAMIGGSYGLRRGLERLTKKRIVRGRKE